MLRSRLRNHRRIAAVAGIAVTGVVVAATLAGATSDSQTYTGCLTAKGTIIKVRIGTTPRKPCNPDYGEKKISWNETGPTGLPGQDGQDGQDGSPGISKSFWSGPSTVTVDVSDQARTRLLARTPTLPAEWLSVFGGVTITVEPSSPSPSRVSCDLIYGPDAEYGFRTVFVGSLDPGESQYVDIHRLDDLGAVPAGAYPLSAALSCTADGRDQATVTFAGDLLVIPTEQGAVGP